MGNISISTAQTLSTNAIPGQDVFLPTSNSDSFFTFGDFRIEKSNLPNIITSNQKSKTFTNYDTLETLTPNAFDVIPILNLNSNELNLKKTDPNSYSYFGSFKNQVANAITNLLNIYPFSILIVNTGSTGNSVINNYSFDVRNFQSSFSIPINSLSNQGRIPLFSGFSEFGTVKTLYDNTTQFCFQFSGDTTDFYYLVNYSYDTSQLYFTVSGQFLPNGITGTSTNLILSPTPEIFGAFTKGLSRLQKQILIEQELQVINPDDDSYVLQTFTWPTSIDGYNIDSYGINFQNYVDNLLSYCDGIDAVKSNWLIREMVPEDYLVMDTDDGIYRSLLNVFADEFDYIKQYIDALAFAHTVTYTGEESIPTRFLNKLSDLLGLSFSNSFSDFSLYEYLANADEETGKTIDEYNNELWRKLLVNINWLYKKKGTRQAILFIFKLIGAPDDLVRLNEYTYTIKKSINYNNDKVNLNGYINYNNSQFIFQESDDGSAYIDQWTPEFSPIKTVDNIKTAIGTDEFFGTENIINTKEVSITLTSANAVEADVKKWYDLGFGTWNWGSDDIYFSGLTLPFLQYIDNTTAVTTSQTTAFTTSEWVEYIYVNNIDPTTRKTLGYKYNLTVYQYEELSKLYYNYQNWFGYGQSNRLTIKKLDNYLKLIERDSQHYIPQLLPATTIQSGSGTVYKNPEFILQKFVYKPGINDGSEFKIKVPAQYDSNLYVTNIQSKINDKFDYIISAINVNSKINDNLNSPVTIFSVNSQLNDSLESVNIITNVKSQLNDNLEDIIVTSKLVPDYSVKNNQSVKITDFYIDSNYVASPLLEITTFSVNSQILVEQVSYKFKVNNVVTTIIDFPQN